MRRKPKRSADQAQTTLSLPLELLKLCQERADSLGLSRSAYIVQLLRQDTARGGSLVLNESAVDYKGAPKKTRQLRHPPSDLTL